MDWFLYVWDLRHERANTFSNDACHFFFLSLEISVFKEECMDLKNKLMEFKEKAIDGFGYLDKLVHDVENNSLVDIERLKANINSFMLNIKERSEKIEEKIDLIKGKLEGTPVADLFQKLADEFKEYKEAFKPRLKSFIGALEDLENGKEGAVDALKDKIGKGKKECKEVLETVKTQAMEIGAQLIKIQIEMVAKIKSKYFLICNSMRFLAFPPEYRT